MGIKSKTAVVLCALCLFLLGIMAYAEDMSDLISEGSVSVMAIDNDTGEAVTGGTLSLYKTADVSGADYYVYTDDYKDCDIDLSNSNLLEQPDTADSFAGYTAEHNIEPVRTETAGDPTVFASVSIGLYIVIQNDPAEGYEAISPFLISVPMLINGEYTFDITVTLKAEATASDKEEVPDAESSPVIIDAGAGRPVNADKNSEADSGYAYPGYVSVSVGNNAETDGNGSKTVSGAGTGETFLFLALAGFSVCMGTGLLSAFAFGFLEQK